MLLALAVEVQGVHLVARISVSNARTKNEVSRSSARNFTVAMTTVCRICTSNRRKQQPFFDYFFWTAQSAEKSRHNTMLG